MSYETFLRRPAVLTHPWDRVICDEGQRIKGEDTTTSEKVWQLQSKNKWILTGMEQT